MQMWCHSLLEIKTGSGTQYIANDLVNVFFSIPVSKGSGTVGYITAISSGGLEVERASISNKQSDG